MQTIYIVSYMNENDTESTVTAFNNEKAAKKAYNYFSNKYNYAWLDEVPLYSQFYINF